MPKNRGHIESLARSYTHTAIKTLAGIMMEQTSPPMARIAAAKVLLDRGWGRPSETHHIDVNGETSLLKVVNEIVHVHETREQIEFRDQTPLLELTPLRIPTTMGRKVRIERDDVLIIRTAPTPPMPRTVRPGGRQHRLELATQRRTAKFTLSSTAFSPNARRCGIVAAIAAGLSAPARGFGKVARRNHVAQPEQPLRRRVSPGHGAADL